MGTLRAEKQIYNEYGNIEKSKYFTEIAKYVSKLGSVMLLDVMDENDIYEYVYEKYNEMVEYDLKQKMNETKLDQTNSDSIVKKTMKKLRRKRKKSYA